MYPKMYINNSECDEVLKVWNLIIETCFQLQKILLDNEQKRNVENTWSDNQCLVIQLFYDNPCACILFYTTY